MATLPAALAEKQISGIASGKLEQALAQHEGDAAGKSATAAAGSAFRASSTPGFLGRTIGRAEGFFSGLQSKLMLLFAGSFVLSKLQNLGRPFKLIHGVVQAPVEAMSSSTVGRLASGTIHAFGTATGAIAAQGQEPLAPNRISAAHDFVKGREAKVGQVVFDSSKRAFSAMGSAVEKVAGKWKFIDQLRLKSVASHLAKADTAYNGALTELNQGIEALKVSNHLDEARGVLEAARNTLLAEGKSAATHGFLTETSKQFAKKMAAAGEAVEALDSKAEGVEALRKAIAQATKSSGKNIAAFANNILKTGRYEFGGTLRQNFAKGMAQIPERISNMTGERALTQGIYYTSQAAVAYSTAKLFSVATQKHMYESITGKKPGMFFFLKVWTGNLPEVMKSTSKSYWLSTLPRAAVNVASMVILAMFNRGGMGWKGTMVGGVAQAGVMGLGAFVDGANNLTTSYEKIVSAQSAGQEVPLGAYVGLMLYASPKIAQLGPHNEAVKQIAREYAAAKISAGEVLRDIETGKFAGRFAELEKQFPTPVVTPATKAAAEAAASPEAKPVTIGQKTFVPAQKASAGAKMPASFASAVEQGRDASAAAPAR